MTWMYLQNETAGYCGNSPMWYRKGGNGYTPRLDEAEKFKEAKADEIIRGSEGTHRWKKWPVLFIDSIAHRAVDIQDIRKAVDL
jgi:hypothetical protein